jgi:hypothetical protein
MKLKSQFYAKWSTAKNCSPIKDLHCQTYFKKVRVGRREAQRTVTYGYAVACVSIVLSASKQQIQVFNRGSLGPVKYQKKKKKNNNNKEGVCVFPVGPLDLLPQEKSLI